MAVGKDDVQRTVYIPKSMDKTIEEFAALFSLSYAAAHRLMLIKGLGGVDVDQLLKDMQKNHE